MRACRLRAMVKPFRYTGKASGVNQVEATPPATQSRATPVRRRRRFGAVA
jgi:hypothetical protein